MLVRYAVVMVIFMIDSVTLAFGRTPGCTGQEITAAPVTLIIGPNNSGKSILLKEIYNFCRTGTFGNSLLKHAKISGVPKELVQLAIDKVTWLPSAPAVGRADHVFVGKGTNAVEVQKKSLEFIINDPSNNITDFCRWYLNFRTLLLDGPSRIGLVNMQKSGDLQRKPESSLEVLFKDDKKRHEVRRVVQEAFGSYFVIDPTHTGHFRIRMSPAIPPSDSVERGLSAESIAFHSQAELVENASDGVKAFIGIITAIIAGDPSILLIDEPEAFLHPSLADKLGVELSLAAVKEGKRIFAATHSQAFLMGCINSGVPITIIRLTYKQGIATSRVLPSSEVTNLMKHPLLRSAGMLSGLFYESVVMTESDADRAFYQEINERLLRSPQGGGVPNCLFINAQNKQTLHVIMRPLRQMGIPAACVADIDVIKEGGKNWSNLLSGADVPAPVVKSANDLRLTVVDLISISGKNMKIDGGVSVLENKDRESLKHLLSLLATYGIFVVPSGELESWMRYLGTTGHGPDWLINIFDRMGSDINATGYAAPTHGDVWDFIRQIQAWISNPRRKGIPH